MHAIVGIGTFICTKVLRNTSPICRRTHSAAASRSSTARNTGVPGAVSQLNLNTALLGRVVA